MNGVLIINKPRGWTSHDVVAKVRRLLRVSKAGHTGTLDPLATGVLVVCVGKATRIARYLESDEKEYDAEIRLGMITDTLDIEGRVLETKSFEPPAEKDIRTVLNEFTGTIRQRPPSFSAVKVHGVPAHRLARSGNAQELPERDVTIFSLDLHHYLPPYIRFFVRCSKGTYIRSLGSDIGARLGTGACLIALIRTKAGQFTIDKAMTVEQLAERADRKDIESALIPLSEVLPGFRRLDLSEHECRLVSHGNAVPVKPGQELMQEGEPVRLMDQNGRLIAVARVKQRFLQPEVVLV